CEDVHHEWLICEPRLPCCSDRRCGSESEGALVAGARSQRLSRLSGWTCASQGRPACSGYMRAVLRRIARAYWKLARSRRGPRAVPDDGPALLRATVYCRERGRGGRERGGSHNTLREGAESVWEAADRFAEHSVQACRVQDRCSG